MTKKVARIFFMLAVLSFLMIASAACESGGGDDDKDDKEDIQETIAPELVIANPEPEIPKPAQPLLTGDIINLNNYVFDKNEDTAFMAEIYTVSPNILSMYVQDAWIEWTPMIPYIEEPGDQIYRRSSYEMILNRNGEDVAFFVTDSKFNEYINFFEKRHGAARLHRDVMQTPENWTFFSMDDHNYYTPAHPKRIFIKSKPVDWTLGMEPGGQAMGHTLYFENDGRSFYEYT